MSQPSTETLTYTGINKLAREIVEIHPQTISTIDYDIDPDDRYLVESPPFPPGIELKGQSPKLQYVIVGSLATMLLSQANEYSSVEIEKDDTYTLGAPQRLEDDVRSILRRVKRPIGDLDFVPTRTQLIRAREFRGNQAPIGKMTWFPDSTTQEYVLSNIRFGGLSDLALKAVNIKQYQRREDGSINLNASIDTDTVSELLPPDIYRIEIEGQEYFVSGPLSMFSTKFLQTIQYFGQDLETDLGMEKQNKLFNELDVFKPIFEDSKPEEKKEILEYLLRLMKLDEKLWKGSKTREDKDFPYKPFYASRLDNLVKRSNDKDGNDWQILNGLVKELIDFAFENGHNWLLNG
jgi:hypothetical protein